MTNETVSDPRVIWQNQPTETNMFAVRYVHTGMTAFLRKARWVNWFHYIVGVSATVYLLLLVYLSGSPLVQIGCAILLCAVIFAVIDIYRHRPKPVPAGIALAEAIAFFKSELTSRRDLYRRQWRYVPPVIPGFVLFLLGYMERHDTSAIVGISVFSTVFLLICYWLALEIPVRGLQKQIDALPRVDEV